MRQTTETLRVLVVLESGRRIEATIGAQASTNDEQQLKKDIDDIASQIFGNKYGGEVCAAELTRKEMNQLEQTVNNDDRYQLDAFPQYDIESVEIPLNTL